MQHLVRLMAVLVVIFLLAGIGVWHWRLYLASRDHLYQSPTGLKKESGAFTWQTVLA